MRATPVKVVDHFPVDRDLLARCVDHLKEFGLNPRCCELGRKAAEFVDQGLIVFQEDTDKWVIKNPS